MSTTKTDPEAVREDIERTRTHLAGTVQELTDRLTVPHRFKETAGQAGQKVSAVAGQAGEKLKEVPGAAKDLPVKARQNPKAAAMAGGVLALVVAAVTWLVRRGK